MNVRQIVLLCFASALCGGNTRLVSAKISIFTGAEGGNGSLSCPLAVSGRRKFFCKNECKAEDILVKTDGGRAQSGRFSVDYKDGNVIVTIIHLTKSDEGRYRCGLGGTLLPDSYIDFEIRVTDATLFTGKSYFILSEMEGEDIIFLWNNKVYRRWKFLCRGNCTNKDLLIETDQDRAVNGRYSMEYKKGPIFGLFVTIRQVTKSDTGWYVCGYGNASSPESYTIIPIFVFDVLTLHPSSSTSAPSDTTSAPNSTFSSVFLFPLVAFGLVVVFLLAIVALLCHKPKTSRNPGSRNSECVMYENCPPGSREDQSLDPAGTARGQMYSKPKYSNTQETVESITLQL